jgi:hypothetical protein
MGELHEVIKGDRPKDWALELCNNEEVKKKSRKWQSRLGRCDQ